MPNPVNGASGIAWGRATNAEPVPVRLRQLIVDHANRDGPVPTPLHALSLRDAGSAAPDDEEFEPELAQRTRAEIVASAAGAIVAQANLTQRSVRALLGIS